MTPTITPEAARLAEELRDACMKIRVKASIPLSALIPIMQRAADEIERLAAKQDAAPTSASTVPAAQQTPALKRHALEAAKTLSEYAAAPFFPDTEKRGKVRATTAEWWDGLAELIEEAQPLIARALRECTEPLARNPGACSVTDGEAKK